MNKEKVVVAFSGGRTSAYMCWWLITHMSNIYQFTFIYANTGMEHEKTLEFVNKVDKFLNLNLIWVEADVKNGSDATYTTVDFKTACRDNRLFMEMAKVYGIMTVSPFIHCTRELKNRPIRKFCVDYLGYDYRIALGIRYDEFTRVKKRKDAIYPLATITKKTKADILEFWNKQPFDLEIEEHQGNCQACFKKSDKKLKMLADETPEIFNGFIEMENKYKWVKSKDENTERIIYRGHRTAFEVQNNLKLPENLLDLDECAEECGSMISEYESEPIINEDLGLLNFT